METAAEVIAETAAEAIAETAVERPAVITEAAEMTKMKDRFRNFRVSWTQGQEIELFSDLSGNVQTLLPGAEGSYPFILENNNSFHVIFTLSIEEDSLHIPMRFRIVTYKDRKPLTDWWDTQNGGAAESDTVRLGAGESKSYLLEWQWPYESGKDGIDTNAGKADLDYRVRLKI
ncbi:MAG: hypothetical protein ACLTW9_10780 [Enterocloster sp.]